MAFGNDKILDMMEQNYLKLYGGGKNEEPHYSFSPEKENQKPYKNEKQSDESLSEASKLEDELNNIAKPKPKKFGGLDMGQILSLMSNPLVQQLLASTSKKEEPKKPTLPDFIKNLPI